LRRLQDLPDPTGGLRHDSRRSPSGFRPRRWTPVRRTPVSPDGY